MAEHYEIIMIGSGAGGGTLAHTVADSGKRSLLLERGNYLPREQANSDSYPASSVLDANCKAHELDNLDVIDTSFFRSIGAVNPALTAMANAIRVGEHLVERMA